MKNIDGDAVAAWGTRRHASRSLLTGGSNRGRLCGSLLPIVCLATAGVVRAGAEPSQPVTGARAFEALVGNTVAGSTPDGAYADYFLPNGTTVHADRDGSERGRWVLRGDTLCVSFPEDDAEDCRALEVDGARGAFVDRDGSRYPFEILAGNARRL